MGNNLAEVLLGFLGDCPPAADQLRHAAVNGESRFLIDGELVESSSGRRFNNVDPATEELLGETSNGTIADMQGAIAAARRAFDETKWSTDASFRRRCVEQLQDGLRKHADEFRVVLTRELGCPIRMTYGDQYANAVEKLGFYANMATEYEYTRQMKDQPLGPFTNQRYILREPVGVVGAIVPWNIPVELELAKVGAALAGGNTVVLKPAPDTPWSATVLGRIVKEDTEIPAGVFNVVASTDNEVAACLVSDSRVDAVAFTGSTATGKKVMSSAAETVKRVTLELGGKAPNVVLEDVDLDHVLPIAAAFACFNSGQSCIVPSRLIVPASKYRRCVELAASGLEAVPFGDPFDPGKFMGPLISAAHMSRVDGFVAKGRSDGGKVVTGGRRSPGFKKGYYYEPTLFSNLQPDCTLAQEEIFGPVLVILPYKDEDEAIRIANNTRYGLAAYVWSSSPERGMVVSRKIRCGMVSVNGGNFIGGDMPFGGRKHSGMGREWGLAGFEEFLDLKSIGVAA